MSSSGLIKGCICNRKGEVKWSLHEIEVPTVEQCVKEDALEVQDIRELGLGWAWFMNDLRAFLPAWQEMELASPSSEEPVTQIEADVPIEPIPLQADATSQTGKTLMRRIFPWRPLSRQVDPYGSRCAHFFRVSAKNGPAREQVVRRVTRDLHTRHVLEDLLCDSHLQVPLHVNVFLPVVLPRAIHGIHRPLLCIACFLGLMDLMSFLQICVLPVFLGGGGGSASFQNLMTPQSAALWGRELCLSCDSSLRMLKRMVRRSLTQVFPNST